MIAELPSAPTLDAELLDALLDEHHASCLPKFERLWDYYRNPMRPGDVGGRWYRLGQEQGLPARITRGRGEPSDGAGASSGAREVVIENDIAWRVHALVDFMFGKAVAMQSGAADPQRARKIEAFLRGVFDAAGGVAFFQDLALMGAVYGHADVLVRVNHPSEMLEAGDAPSAGDDAPGDAQSITLEIIEPTRGIPLLNADDYRRLDAYVLHYRQLTHGVEPAAAGEGLLTRLRNRLRPSVKTQPAGKRVSVECTETWTDETFTKYRSDARGRTPVEEGVNILGRVPVVHIQNLAQPFFYEGLSEVEPLIPLQDELNTRLSDRANRVTFQCFKMYLGKGVEGFIDRPIGPGQMWATDNEQASIEEFGGDAASPSEESHIREIREAMDKTSAVTAVAAGLINSKVGNLTSENALRITMTGLLAKTEKKRVTYGVGIQNICELLLHAADVTGLLPNTPDERRVRLDWPSPLPDDATQRLRDAQLKLAIGVSRKQVLVELGYAEVREGE